jgi:hypothetical protein
METRVTERKLIFSTHCNLMHVARLRTGQISTTLKSLICMREITGQNRRQGTEF